jgi:HSP20 family protein
MNRQNQNVMNFGGFLEDLLNGNGGRLLKDELFPNEWFRGNVLPVNLKEQEDRFVLEAVAPGLSKEDFKLKVNDNVLSISFEVKKEEEKETESQDEKAGNEKILKHEFAIRSFNRSFKLGNKVDVDKISARYDNGILTLILPKKESEKASNKSIAID